MLKLGSEVRRLDCELTYDEKQARAQRAAEISELAGAEKERATRMKEEAAGLLKQSEAHLREASMLLSYFKAEIEPRDVPCDMAYELDTGDIVMIRKDTFKIIERRKPTHDEWNRIKEARQQPLFRSSRDPVEDGEGSEESAPTERPKRKARGAAAPAAPAPAVNLTIVKPEDAPAGA